MAYKIHPRRKKRPRFRNRVHFWGGKKSLFFEKEIVLQWEKLYV